MHSVGQGSSVATAVEEIKIVAQICSLAWELHTPLGQPKKREKKSETGHALGCCACYQLPHILRPGVGQLHGWGTSPSAEGDGQNI